MADPQTQPAAAPSAAPPPADQRTSITDAQAREAMAAAAEVLGGAGPARILQLAGKIELAKMLTAQIAAGSLLVVSRSPA